VKLYSERNFCRWKLLVKPEREMIGFCGVGFWVMPPDPEIGWWWLANGGARDGYRSGANRTATCLQTCRVRPDSFRRTAGEYGFTRIMEKLD